MGRSAGKVMPLPRGPYDSKEVYNILDLVTYNNKLWMATKSNFFGILPSTSAEEWMLAVDGTTDVKGLETIVNEKFSEIDTKFTGYDADINALHTQGDTTEANVENLSTSVSELSTRCTNIESAIVPDTKVTKDSNKLITSGSVYNMFDYSETMEGSNDGDYEVQASHASFKNSVWLTNNTEQRYTESDGLMHRDMDGTISIQSGMPILRYNLTPRSDSVSEQYSMKQSNSITVANEITMDFETNSTGARNKQTYLYFNSDSMRTQDSATYDIGESSYKFRNIYASTGTIQTSDRTEKKDIVDITEDTAKDLIMGLNPVTYKFIDGTSDRTHYGLIAQDVEELINGLGIDNKDFAGLIKSPKLDEDQKPIDGEYIYGLRYDEFVAPLIKMCQNLQSENLRQQSEIDELRSAINTLKRGGD